MQLSPQQLIPALHKAHVGVHLRVRARHACDGVLAQKLRAGLAHVLMLCSQPGCSQCPPAKLGTSRATRCNTLQLPLPSHTPGPPPAGSTPRRPTAAAPGAAPCRALWPHLRGQQGSTGVRHTLPHRGAWHLATRSNGSSNPNWPQWGHLLVTAWPDLLCQAGPLQCTVAPPCRHRSNGTVP
jgi:hypothetical protein